MAEDLGDVREVCTSVEHARGGSVAESVRADGREPGSLAGVFHHSAHGACRDLLVRCPRVQEEPATRRSWPTVLEIVNKSIPDDLGKRQDPLDPFPADDNLATAPAKIGEVERGDLPCA